MMRLSVNLSVQQLQHDSCLAIVEESAARAASLPSISTSRSPRASSSRTDGRRHVAKMKERGISITVDDFGTATRASYLRGCRSTR